MRSRSVLVPFCLVLAAAVWTCGQGSPAGSGAASPSVSAPVSGTSRPGAAPLYAVKIVGWFPHDPRAFTEGLIFLDGYLYESTGRNGRSSIRKVELETGRVVRRYNLPARYFGEGLASWKRTLVQLTWSSRRGFVYNRDTFAIKRRFRYRTEGWGLTQDGKSLIMSDGSNRLTFLDPVTFGPERVLEVWSGGRPVDRLNELEFIKGEIYANVWRTDTVARICPQTGEVTGWIDMSGLRRELPAGQKAEVLNGIAYDAEKDRIFATGKLWPKLFEVEIIEKGK